MFPITIASFVFACISSYWLEHIQMSVYQSIKYVLSFSGADLWCRNLQIQFNHNPTNIYSTKFKLWVYSYWTALPGVAHGPMYFLTIQLIWLTAILLTESCIETYSKCIWFPPRHSKLSWVVLDLNSNCFNLLSIMKHSVLCLNKTTYIYISIVFSSLYRNSI